MIFKPRTHVYTNIFVIFFLKIEIFDLHEVSIFDTGTGESDTPVTPPPFFLQVVSTIYREIINIMTIMMKTIKRRLHVYTKYIFMCWGFCLFLEFTFVFFTSDIHLHNTLVWKGKLSILTTCVGPILNA